MKVSILLHASFCFVGSRVIKAEINGPSDDVPIRLSTSKRAKPITTPHHWRLHDPPSTTNYQNTESVSGGAHVGDTSNKHSPSQRSPSGVVSAVGIEIVEPPNSSYIAGKTFYVKIKLSVKPVEEEAFKQTYGKDGRVCLSLDGGLFHCWNLNDANILYSQVPDGEHKLVAMLYNDGKLQNQTISESVIFTMVHDPQFEDVEHNIHDQLQMSHHQGDHDLSDEGQNDTTGVQVTYPPVQIINPSNEVTYSGTEIAVETLIEPQDPELFQKYFNRSFNCFSIDEAEAFACFPIFNTISKPLIIGFKVGMHTIVGMLSNPETGEVLENSSTGKKIFYLSGKDDEGAYAVVDINIKGKVYRVPLIEEGSIVQQTQYLCSISGSVSEHCFEAVFSNLESHQNDSSF